MKKGTFKGRLHEFYTLNHIQMCTTGEGVKKSEKNCGHHIWKLLKAGLTLQLIQIICHHETAILL